MHRVQQAIVERLAGLPEALAPVRAHAERFAAYCSSVAADGTLHLGHTPWIAPEAYAVRLYPAAKAAWVRGFRERTGISVPKGYAEALGEVNGAEFCGLSLFGLAPSMQRTTPTLDRSRSQPLDLSLANPGWAREYAGAGAQEGFHFGSRDWSRTEIVGYFWGRGGVSAVRKSGEVVGEWQDLPTMLEEELPRAMARLDEATPASWWH